MSQKFYGPHNVLGNITFKAFFVNPHHSPQCENTFEVTVI